jgi:serine/threonine protein phosphatase PrpC
MITCPECGQQANDDARFCDRCGQGLSNNAARPRARTIPPLELGTELKRGFKIVALLSQASNENRYRAERASAGIVERFQLREQLGPAPDMADFAVAAATSDPENPPQPENPNGPHAKTADLKLHPASITAQAETAPPKGSLAENGNAPADLTSESANPDAQTAVEPDDSAVSGSEQAHAAADAAGSEGGSLDLTDAAAAVVLTEPVPDSGLAADSAPGRATNPAPEATNGVRSGASAQAEQPLPPVADDLGEVFGRVLALSLTLNHPAFQRALDGFADGGRVYLVYRDDELTALAGRPSGLQMSEAAALSVGIQVCQAVAFVHRRGLRLNDLCPESIAWGEDGRLKLTGLDYVSNDNELQAAPIFNDGYSAPEIYRARKVDKRADIFSVGALLYTCLTGERLDSETWREEAGPIGFYPPHVVTPAVEQAVRRALLFDPAARWPNIDAFKTELLRLSGVIDVRAGVMSDVGMVRELNEDAVIAVEYHRESLIEPAQSFLYVIADGMGGAEAGEVASAIAVDAIRNYVGSRIGASAGVDKLRGLLQDALEDANSRIIDYQAAHQEARGMGSTAVSVLITPPHAAVAWVGDSRAYLCEHSGLKQLTKDHSLVQRLIEIGQITPEEGRHHEHKNVITRSLGARQSGPAGAESLTLRLKRGDCLMLCSDGLTTHVDDESISEVLRRHSDPYEAARELVVAANAGGGTDNVSVVVIFTG